MVEHHQAKGQDVPEKVPSVIGFEITRATLAITYTLLTSWNKDIYDASDHVGEREDDGDCLYSPSILLQLFFKVGVHV